MTVRHFDKKKDDNQNKSLNVEITTSTQVDNKELKDIKKQNKKTKQKEKKTESLVINIISNNINGLKVRQRPYLLESIFSKMYEIDIDILMLQETNTNMKHPESKKVLQSATQKYQSIQQVWSESPFNTSTSYKPGGVAILIKNPLAKHIVTRIIDTLGRWAGVTLTLKNKQITIISIYQPPKQQVKGTINVTAQQTRWIQDNEMTTTVKQQFRIDLNNMLSKITSQDNEIILGGDFNEHATIGNILQDIMVQHKLIDIMSTTENQYSTTYNRGTHILDKIFVSKGLINSNTRITMEDYDKITTSDHRPIHLQLHLREEINQQINLQDRQLNSSHLYQVEKYIENVHYNMKKQKIFEMVKELKTDQEIEKKLNTIDYKMTQIRLNAEKLLRSRKRDWWHKELVKWKQTLKKCNKTLKNLTKQTPKPHESIRNVLKEKQKMIQNFRQHTEHGYQIRHKLIQEEVSELYQEDPINKPKIKRLKQILRNEMSREIYRKIKNKTVNQQYTQMKLQIKKEDNNIEIIEDIDQISKQIAEYNMTHFAQAKNTPLANYTHNKKEEGQSKESITILEHETNHSTSEEMTQLKEKFLERIDQEPKVTSADIITEEEWIKKISKWKESTTTSPSGLHLGHHKAYFKPHASSYEENSDRKKEIDQKQNDLLTVFIEFINKVIQNGISLKRWQTVHSIAIPKDKNNTFVHRIRNIHIYEADYNFILKQKWGEAVASAEKHEQLHTSQYGSRKSRTSLDPVAIEIIQQEYTKMTHTPYVQVNYDAQACYDRIIPEIALKISKKYGIHENILKIVRKTLRNSKYYIKIGNVITKQSYGNSKDTKLFGTGQGSGCSPHIWTLLSSELFHLYSEEAQGSSLKSPHGERTIYLDLTAYVDDVNTHHSFDSKTTIPQMIDKVTKQAQLWSNILHISGGKLSNTKCNFYLSSMTSATTGRYQIKNEIAPNIHIKDQEGSVVTISQVLPNDTHKSLGYMQSIANTSNSQETWISTKMNMMTQITRSADLTYQESQIYYRTIYYPRIQYVTHLSSITKTSSDKISNQGVHHILPKMGYSSSTPHGVTFGHRSYGGLGLTNIWLEQGARNLITLTKGLTGNSILANAIQTVTQWWRFQIGIEGNPFQICPENITYVKSKWFNNICKFIREYNLQVNLKGKHYSRLRQNDAFIMDIVLEQQYTQKIIGNINQCRLFLHALTISDITDIQGTHIMVQCHTHKEANTMKTENSTSFQVSKPNKSIWSYWNKFLKTLTHPKSRRLKTPLGPWITSNTEVRRKYNMYRDEEHVYQYKQDKIFRTNIKTRKVDQTTKIPERTIPSQYTVTGAIIPKYTEKPVAVNEIIKSQTVLNIKISDQIIIVTDASVHQDRSAYAWVVANKNGDILAQHQERTSELNISSFRAEAMGVLDALKTLHTTILQQKLQWTLHCDNQAVIKRLEHIKHHDPKFEWTDSDVLREIKKYMPPGGEVYHVKGHTSLSKNTTIAEKLNILADKKANEAINGPPTRKRIEYTVQIKGGQVSIYSITQVVAYCQIKISEKYLKEKFKETYDNIDWITYKTIAQEFKGYMSITKMLSGLSPTKKRLHKMQQAPTSKCPICEIHEEDISHILFCSRNNENITNQKEYIIKKLEKYGEIQEITNEIISCIQHDRNMTQKEISKHQQDIGWIKMIQGKVAKDFMHNFEKIFKKKENIQKYVLSLMKLIITQWRKAWIHRLNITLKRNEEQVNSDRHQKNITNLQHLYENQQWLTKAQKLIMHSNIQEHMKQSQTQIDSWIKIHYRSLENKIKEQKLKKMTTEQKREEDLRIPCEACDGTPDVKIGTQH